MHVRVASWSHGSSRRPGRLKQNLLDHQSKAARNISDDVPGRYDRDWVVGRSRSAQRSAVPVVTDRPVGNYIVSLWADPDASDEGDADGRFWVVVNPAAKGASLPADTVVRISIWLAERPDSIHTETATADGQEISRRAAAFAISREGKYRRQGDDCRAVGTRRSRSGCRCPIRCASAAGAHRSVCIAVRVDWIRLAETANAQAGA